MSAFFETGGRQATPVHRLGDLSPGHSLPGPALLVADTSTTVVEPGCTAHITPEGNVRIDIPAPAEAASEEEEEEEDKGVEAAGADGGGVRPAPPPRHAVHAHADPVTLSLFGHRFMGIAEQMGRTLQRTAVSVNIKERLDFSCALFGPDGALVANAPHLPVHLGAMADAVRFQVAHWTDPSTGACTLVPGDVLASNHPQLAGGSHLPDITVITPVFEADTRGSDILFFVASRGHHADVGGITPGSMPPTSTCLAQEGAALLSFKLVDGATGAFDEAGIAAALAAPAALAPLYPGCAGTRNLADNLSDLRAQVAANTRGIALVRALIGEHGRGTVAAYMAHIQANAEGAVRGMLRAFSARTGLPPVGTVTAADAMDDGSPIALAVTIDREAGSATFDFTGTGPQVLGNTNAPPAVSASAVIYALRAMVDADIPLNQGCLTPVTLVIPPGCLLAPDPEAAVVGGNVLTSQRVTDVVLKAFSAAADSQGCMNNLTFGDGALAYYETIAGGAGAGPGWAGRSGVHTHMTNTRITDPEILERRYPVILRAFHLRAGSGGDGAWAGGEGVVREIEFLRPQTVSILSERRALRPCGLAGGRHGAAGLNLLIRRDGRTLSLGGKATVEVAGGDRLRILTPGGGGYGVPGAAAAPGGGSSVGAQVAGAARPALPPVRAVGSVHAFKAAQESA
jgi:5-oxoprolinase (ATP-hydrolysing)